MGGLTRLAARSMLGGGLSPDMVMQRAAAASAWPPVWRQAWLALSIFACEGG